MAPYMNCSRTSISSGPSLEGGGEDHVTTARQRPAEPMEEEGRCVVTETLKRRPREGVKAAQTHPCRVMSWVQLSIQLPLSMARKYWERAHRIALDTQHNVNTTHFNTHTPSTQPTKTHHTVNTPSTQQHNVNTTHFNTAQDTVNTNTPSTQHNTPSTQHIVYTKHRQHKTTSTQHIVNTTHRHVT